MMMLDATDMVLGRLASEAARQALRGEKVAVVNCEKAVITGNKRLTIQRWLHARAKGQPTKGPFVQTKPHLFVRRTIRGMLPHKNQRGRDALDMVKCYVGVPEAFAKEKPHAVKGAHVKKLQSMRYMSIAELCTEIRERK